MRTRFGCLSSRMLIAALAALVLTASTASVAGAQSDATGGAGDAVLQSLPADLARDRLLSKVQYWGCERCRNYCYVTWRINCGFSPYCRRSFVLCMRDCWYRFCR